MNYKQATIENAFNLYHRANPAVYVEFKNLALRAISLGRKQISAKMICNVIRWEKFIQTEEPTLWNQDGVLVKFKLNDAYTSRYARLFAEEYPEHADKLEMRELRS